MIPTLQTVVMRDQLLQMIQKESFQRGKFVLSSGLESDYYLDLRSITSSGQSAYLIGELLYEQTKALDVDAVGGLAVGAVPLVTATTIAYYRHGRPMGGFWVRDKAKMHGTGLHIEGQLLTGSRVAILEDVLTTGESARKAIEVVFEHGCTVRGVFAIVDRLQGARERFVGMDVPLHSLFMIDDVLGVAP